MILSIVGSKIKKNFRLNDNPFVNLSEVQLGGRLGQERSLT